METSCPSGPIPASCSCTETVRTRELLQLGSCSFWGANGKRGPWRGLLGYSGKSHEDTGGRSAKTPDQWKGMGAELLEKGWVKSKGTKEETQ